MNIQKYRQRKAKEDARSALDDEKAFRKECIKEYKRLYRLISGYMNDEYSKCTFKMKQTRSETVAILSLLSRYDWLSGEKFCKPMGDFMDVEYTYFYTFSWS